MKGVVWAAACGLLAAASAAVAEPGAWITKELDSGGGSAKYFVSQVASSEQLVNADGKKQRATLSVRCEKKGLFVTFLWPEYVAGDTYDGKTVDVTVKVDDGRLREAKLQKVDQAAIALGTEGFRLLKDADGGKTLTVRIPDMYGGQTATFPIDGISTIYGRIKGQGCS